MKGACGTFGEEEKFVLVSPVWKPKGKRLLEDLSENGGNIKMNVNPLAPIDIYISYPTANFQTLLNIYSTNILTEYFKHAGHSPFFSLQDAVYFIMLSFLVPVIFTF